MTDAKQTILVTDDDAEIRKVLTLVLERSGFSVLAAAHGEEALGLMERELPDLILLDIMMPKVDGLEVVRRMRDSDRLREVPVIAFTALTSQLIEKERVDLGVRGFMRKPLHLTDLGEMVGMELKNIAQERAGEAP